jgi:hypothetical protein
MNFDIVSPVEESTTSTMEKENSDTNKSNLNQNNIVKPKSIGPKYVQKAVISFKCYFILIE